ncbi:hypothetical protein TSAR_009007 [Trichomalopsis sarcophagae]|uniref:Uncharacterized protein n=1 Tax=Trichomalopsis sarcophagae TaxID=543379 RepID=A0A232EW06_9HYME|nr:hypothetical protein TSAR_009007 [Trichomalopsis sarcophagae]
MNFGPKLSSNFISSPYIRKLTLQNNRLVGFEDGTFDGVPNLEYLDLSHNNLNLNKLFSFGGHQKLKTLILDYNNAGADNSHPTTTPDYYNYGYHTTENDYHNRNMNSNFLQIYLMGKFPELKDLSLRYINMQSASSGWNYNFPNLYRLDISGNKFQKPIHHIFGDILSIIKSLILVDTNLTKFGGSSLFKNIQTLNVAHNNFNLLSYSDCDDDTFCLNNFDNLEYLNISNCAISSIKLDAFKSLVNLLELDMSDNQFYEIPDGAFNNLTKLTRLDLSRNKLSGIPIISNLPNLSTLILNDMKTDMISIFMETELPNLKSLSLQGNNIQYILENFITNLPMLQELDLSNNHIETLPVWESSNILSKLYLNHNAIRNFDNITSVITDSLQILDIGNNPLKKIEVKSLKKLSGDAIIIL